MPKTASKGPSVHLDKRSDIQNMRAGGASAKDKSFSFPDGSIGEMGTELVAGLISATADIALVLDHDGIIQDISLSKGDLVESGIGSWVGKPWIETVTSDSRDKILDILDVKSTGSAGRWQPINHKMSNGHNLPVRYLMFSLGASGHLLAFGQDQWAIASLQQRLVEAQQSVEREYSRLRLAETRYRLLFQVTGEPVLIVDAETLRIQECNPAAAAIFNSDAKRFAGHPILKQIATNDQHTLERYLEKVRSGGNSGMIECGLASNGPTVMFSASLFRQDNKAFFLIRFASSAVNVGVGEEDYGLTTLIGNLPDAFVVTDSNQCILTANNAFLDLTQLASLEQLSGERLDRWLGRTEVDFRVLVNTLAERGAVRRYATAVRGEFGASEEVEVSVVGAHNRDQECFGFVFHQIADAGVGATAAQGDADLLRTVEKLAELVGRVPLKDIVRETTDMIERMCIEAALDLTGDNRASAADVLGLSRQSLYVKLRRFGLRDYARGDMN